MQQNSDAFLSKQKKMEKNDTFCSIFHHYDCSKTWPICVNHQMINCPLLHFSIVGL